MKKKFLVLIPTIYLLGFFLGAEIQYIHWVTIQFHDFSWGSPLGQIIGLVFHTGLLSTLFFLYYSHCTDRTILGRFPRCYLANQLEN